MHRTGRRLVAISVADLPLLQVAHGRVLHGTLVSDPSVGVAVTGIFEDQAGGRCRLILYNCVPGGGEEAHDPAEAFPQGARVSIAEPYLDVMVDGIRSVRVDDPSGIHVGVGAGPSPIADLAAAEASWRAVRAVGGDVAALLSHRAKALLQLGRCAAALRDAAAAILLDPTRGESWQSYAAAAEGLGSEDVAARARDVRGDEYRSPARFPVIASTRARLREALSDLVASASAASTAAEQPQEFMERGHDAYRLERYGAAARLFSRALGASASADQAALILSDLAGSALRMGVLHDAIAAAAASFCLRPLPKALHHLGQALASLGELKLADEFLASVLASPDIRLHADLAKILSGLLSDVRNVSTHGRPIPSLVREWVSNAVEVVDMGPKGRGVVAMRDILPNQTLMLQRPRLTITDHVEGASMKSSDFREFVLRRVQSDALLASVVAQLYDGSGATPPVTQLKTMLDLLSERVLPLLSQRPAFFPFAEQVRVSAGQVLGVAAFNGFHGVSSFDELLLFPAISLLNHDQSPNCGHRLFHGKGWPLLMGVKAKTHISVGTELTIKYGHDEAEVAREWGFRNVSIAPLLKRRVACHGGCTVAWMRYHQRSKCIFSRT